MEGDYNRYLAEFCPSTGAKEAAKEAYDKAWEHGSQSLPATHPVLLGLALNRSVFLFEVMRQADEAKATASQALTRAQQNIASAEPQVQAEAQQIMDLLADNLNLWGAAHERGDGTAVED